MEDIISREFEKEIRNKEEEIDLIDEANNFHSHLTQNLFFRRSENAIENILALFCAA